MYKIIHKHGQPYGIRDSSGYLLFFSQIDKYNDQTDRYIEEITDRLNTAVKIVKFLNQESTNEKTH